ncbi:MAG: DUF2161 family putative PD-(D/E)XK-type phosphodiesterase [Rhizobiaceae bacterium]|nr:DUF2161 family putative PD-(D/E)XK-type phosphodiesterase [Rhizobiaceae bacterium]
MPIKESDLYLPVKSLLEAQGYEVKAEIGSADIMAVRGKDEPPVIVELKTGFSLALVHQAIERLKITDLVYVAIPEWKGRSGWKAFVANRILCRRLGLGLITVPKSLDKADVHLDPAPYTPRKSKKRQDRMLKEFQHRVGDPNEGGINKTKIITSYRQDALRCLAHLKKYGPTKASEVAKAINVERARPIMADDHYGWFERVERGIYAITPKGKAAAKEYKLELKALR